MYIGKFVYVLHFERMKIDAHVHNDCDSRSCCGGDCNYPHGTQDLVQKSRTGTGTRHTEGCTTAYGTSSSNTAKVVELSFVTLDELRGAFFHGSALFRYGKLFYDDGHPDEIVLVPLLYGVSWLTPNTIDQDGTTTRFICSIETEKDQTALSIGVGHQDFIIEGVRQALFGINSIGELMVALFVNDPKFEQKCRARGLDPDTARESMTKERK